MPASLEEVHGIVLSQGLFLDQTESIIIKRKLTKSHKSTKANCSLKTTHTKAPLTCKSLTKVDLAWLILPLFRHREANLSQVSTSSVGGSTNALTAKSACQTCTTKWSWNMRGYTNKNPILKHRVYIKTTLKTAEYQKKRAKQSTTILGNKQ